MFNRLQRAIYQLAQCHNIDPPNLTEFPHVAPGDFDAMYAAVALVLKDFPENLHEQLYETASAAIRCGKDSLFPDSAFDAESGCSSTAEHNDEDILKRLRQAVGDDAAQGGKNPDIFEYAEEIVDFPDALDTDTEHPFRKLWEKNSAQGHTFSSWTTHVGQSDGCAGQSSGEANVQVAGMVMETAGDEKEMTTDCKKDEDSQKDITREFHLPLAEEVAVNGKKALSSAYAVVATTASSPRERSFVSSDCRPSLEFEAEESAELWQKSPCTDTETTNVGIKPWPYLVATEAAIFGKQIITNDRTTKVGSKVGARTISSENVSLPPASKVEAVDKNERHSTDGAFEKLITPDTQISADAPNESMKHDEGERAESSDGEGQVDWITQVCEEIGYHRAEANENIMPLAGVFTNIQRRFGSSYFADPDGTCPEDNADTVAMRAMGMPSREELVAAFGGRTTWTKRERKVLQEAVSDGIGEKLQEGIEERELIETWDKDSWENVLMKGKIGKIGKRDKDDAMCVYLNSEASWVSRIKWKGDEDGRLEEGIKSCLKQAGSGGWVGVARKVGGRGALECLRRWRELEEDRERKRLREWSKEDDTKLGEYIRKFGEGNWALIALMLGGRNGQQCLFRWRKVGAERRIGKWNEEELKRLQNAVKEVGMDWVAVSKRVGGRSDVQCREKWVNCEQPGVAKGGWSAEEDEKLTEMVEVWGAGKWSKVASGVKGRTGAQCKKRWSRLCRKDKRRKMQKVGEGSTSKKEVGGRDLTK